MNSTGTSANVHSQMCFGIKFSAYYRQDTSSKERDKKETYV